MMIKTQTLLAYIGKTSANTSLIARKHDFTADSFTIHAPKRLRLTQRHAIQNLGVNSNFSKDTKVMQRTYKLPLFLSALFLASGLTGCSVLEKGEAKYPTGYDRSITGDDNIYEEPEGIFGGNGLNLFGGNDDKEKRQGIAIGVNSYLWRAALDTVSFMPLASVDPFGGVIISDWYVPETAQNERLKLNVFILSEQLKADGIRVRVFRQLRTAQGWADTKVTDDTARKMEDAVLTRARQLRVADGGGE